MRRLPKSPFDRLAAVLFDSRFRVLRAAIIPYETVLLHSSYVDSVKAWRFMLRDSVREWAGVADATAALGSVEQEI
jgi:hypothetical protein